MDETVVLLSVKEASSWASNYIKKDVTTSNISYLIQYGVVKKIIHEGTICVDKRELEDYYNENYLSKKIHIKYLIGDSGENIDLSFDHLKESETTKHVHRIHPYKGKFIPQLVEYFLDSHTDSFKEEAYFQEGDIILDPFAGSGTTLVEASEHGVHAIGIDVSEFNSLISNVKVQNYDFNKLLEEGNFVTKVLKDYIKETNILDFDKELLDTLNEFNNRNFPVPDFKYQVKNKIIDAKIYGRLKSEEFFEIYKELLIKYDIKVENDNPKTFIDRWTNLCVKNEIEIAFKYIESIEDIAIRSAMMVILSRTVRSCRATTHIDLTTLKEPIHTTYYCTKHFKICKPLFSILKWWDIYLKDTIKRLKYFSKLRTDTFQICLTGDSSDINIDTELEKRSYSFYQLFKDKKIKGIFSSPPYLGLINYHEQHAYAYDIFNFQRNDTLEIGSLLRGQGYEAREEYIRGISKVLLNSKKYLVKDYNIFLVANDKYNLYPTIAKRSGMTIVGQYKRPVLNRSEKDKNLYSEIIFHLKEENHAT